MAINKLTQAGIRTTKPGWYGDGGGLYLNITKAGTRRWIYRWTYTEGHNKQRRFKNKAIGSIEDGMSLADARERAAELRKGKDQGKDPRGDIDNKKAKVRESNQRTFSQVAEEYISINEPTWSNSKHIDQWRMTMLGPKKIIKGKTVDYCKSIKHKPIAEIDLDDVVNILHPIWVEKHDTATKIRQRLESILSYATVKKWRSGDNPARLHNNLDLVLPKFNAPERHFAALPYSEIPEAFEKICKYPGLGALALQFCLVTSVRTNTVCHCRWQDIDLDNAVWTAPEDTMKGSRGLKREYRTPLPRQIIELLTEVHKITGDDEFVFPGRKGGPMSTATMGRVLERCGYGHVTVHGTSRSTFRVWAAEKTNYGSELAEKQLAHTEKNKVVRAYQRSDLLEKRRPLVQDWADYCYSKTGEKNG